MYIGVTGFMHRAEVREALSLVPSDATPYLMVGVLASYTTLQGLPAGNPSRYPKREDISSIFMLDVRALNLVHYNTRDQDHLAAQLDGALRWGGPTCDGLQLNIVWPDASVMRGVRRSRRDVTLVLQINRGAMAACGNSAEKVAERVARDYGDIFDYVLVDASAGNNIPLEPVEAAAYLIELDRVRESHGLRFGLAVAGGLSAHNFAQLLVPVRMLVPQFSIDAEGALRSSQDALDMGRTGSYLDQAFRFFV